MAQRNKLPVDLIWVLVDLGLPQVNALLNVAGKKHKDKASNTELSVNRSADGTQALVKIAEGETGFRNALSGAAKNAIVRVFTEADFPEALAMVKDPAWEPPEVDEEPVPEPELGGSPGSEEPGGSPGSDKPPKPPKP